MYVSAVLVSIESIVVFADRSIEIRAVKIYLKPTYQLMLMPCAMPCSATCMWTTTMCEALVRCNLHNRCSVVIGSRRYPLDARIKVGYAPVAGHQTSDIARALSFDWWSATRPHFCTRDSLTVGRISGDQVACGESQGVPFFRSRLAMPRMPKRERQAPLEDMMERKCDFE